MTGRGSYCALFADARARPLLAWCRLERMARTILVSLLVAVGCAIIVFGLGRLLDSDTLTSVAVWAGAGAGAGYLLTTRSGRNGGDSPR